MMMRSRNLLYIGIVSALLLLSSAPQLSSATLVWAEPFNDLDSGIWKTGSCRLEDGRLRGVEINSTHEQRKILPLDESIWAYRNSTVSVGTWKLELEEMDDWSIEKSINDMTRVYFMTLDTPTNMKSYLALSFRHASSTEGNFFNYRLERYFDNKVTYLDTYSGEAKVTTIGILHQFAITRTSDGLISVYLNGTQILQTIDTDITTTQYFGFYTRIDWALDNIQAYDSIEVGGGLPWILVAVGVGVPVVLVAIVLLMKRR